MRELPERIIEETALQLLVKAATKIPRDILKSLKKAYRVEDSFYAKSQLKLILKSLRISEKEAKLICQDTGTIHFYLKIGRAVKLPPKTNDCIVEAVKRGTSSIPLRPNMVHPLTRVNTRNNVGRGTPFLHLTLEPEIEGVELSLLLKGAGSENLSRTAVFKPTEKFESIRRFIIETVADAGGKGCPPYIVSVVLGGTLEEAMARARMNLLKPIGETGCEELKELEEELLEELNSLGIGVMGLGGKTTVLDVKLDYLHCHTASLPVAVQLQCWALRKSKAYIHPNLEVEYLEL